ncbi:MAG: hypothetical protein ACOCQQ_03350 [Candidatus Nanoarchaeia archaeon]
MAKTIDINTESIKIFFANIQAWLSNFFQTMDQQETIAVGLIALGFVLFIIGLIIV